MIRTGDVVHHRPSGEHWIVAYVKGENLAWVGWPEGEARLEDCDLVESASDESYLFWVRKIAESTGARGEYCRNLLREMGQQIPEGT